MGQGRHRRESVGGDDDIRGLLDDALVVYRGVPAAAARLAALRRRLDEPLRVALVGRVKAGKSTLLNALVGERLAPTDAGECTRVVTWYRRGPTPRVVLHHAEGHERELPVRRVDGNLRLDLAGTSPEDVASLVVDWPTAGLEPATLIDTPGISSLSADASARTRTFIEDGDEDGDQISGADAIVFLTRQLQPEDLAFLSAFQAASGGAGVHTTTIAVLSRADEIGSGRLDALLAAEEAARRMAAQPAVRALSQAVVPVAGLLAVAGRTLRQSDFDALRSLAVGDRSEVEGMLLTADRFCRPDAAVGVPAATRSLLLERLGLFGVRLSVALIRTGTADATALADQLVRRSGLAELERLLAVHFTRRGAQLRAGTALRVVERLLRDQPVAGSQALWRELERVRVGAHDLVELDLLARSRVVDGPLPSALRADAERLLGARGPDPAARLGLPEGASARDLRSAAEAAVQRWRTLAADPLAGRGTLDALDVVLQSAEAVLTRIGPQGSAVGSAEPGAS